MRKPRSLGIVIKLGRSTQKISPKKCSRGFRGEIGTRRCRIVINLLIFLPIGTSSIVDEETHEPRLSVLALIVETAVRLRKDGHKVVIVSSGAIGVGLRRMDIDRRPKHLGKLQVCISSIS